MLYGAKGGSLSMDNTTIDFVTFGQGKENLVIIPGLSDGLKTVKGMSMSMAFMFRDYAKKYRVHIFSRKNEMKEGYNTRDMAKDLKRSMDMCKIDRAHIIGMSQGGMIAQFLAIDFPEVVDKLVIAVSVSRQNETIKKAIGQWISYAKNDDYKTLFIDSLEKTYTEKKLKLYRPFYWILSRIGKPKSWSRFIIQGQACINHNSYDELSKIESTTLVIGGDSDLVVGKNTSEEMAQKIAKCSLIIYENLGHGAFDEAKDFNTKVLDFLK